MKKAITTTSLKELKQNGFKQVMGFNSLFINQAGNAYDRETGKYLTRTKNNYIKSGSKCLNIPKLILQAFKGQKYRAGQMVYIDGNRANLEPDNLKYARLFEPSRINEVNPTDLLTALRCYFDVEKSFKAKNTFKTRLYLQLITEKRGFLVNKNGLQNFQVYRTYLKGLTSNLSQTAKEHGLTIRDCAIIVNDFTNILINEILNDLKSGYLSLYDYKPKQPTKTDIIKQWNEQSGQRPLPLRKQSLKESLKEFEKIKIEIENESVKPGN